MEKHFNVQIKMAGAIQGQPLVWNSFGDPAIHFFMPTPLPILVPESEQQLDPSTLLTNTFDSWLLKYVLQSRNIRSFPKTSEQ